jgi:hypothetical protein
VARLGLTCANSEHWRTTIKQTSRGRGRTSNV